MAAKHGQSIKRQRYNWEEPSLSEASLEAALSTPSCHPPGRCPAPQPNECKRARLQGYQEEEAERPVEAVAGARTGRLVVESPSPFLRKGLPSLLAGKSSPLPRLDNTHATLPRDSDPTWDCHRQKPGRYGCSYCGRLCAKPSVLQKHVRSHTGERPYPCVPCGFSFKTKSNLYKHCKSRAHREKEGWRQTGIEGGQVGGNQEEPTKRGIVDPEDEICLGVVSSPILKEDHQVCEVQGSGIEAEPSTGEPRSMEDAYADGPKLGSSSPGERRTLLGLSDETPPSLEPWTKGSTESGYFSRSESDDKSQVSPLLPAHPEVKTYAEIVLGKFGRLSQRLRNPHRGNPSRLSGQEEQRTSIPLNTPNNKIIEHITKLIATNEAALDSSEIDSVKPRRFSLTRRSSRESLQVSDPQAARLIVWKHEVPSVSADSRTSAAPFLRSHSLPSSVSAREPSPGRFRLSHSFDEWPTTAEEMGAIRLPDVPGCRLIADMLAGPESGFEEDAPDSSTPNTAVPESTTCREQQPQMGYHKLQKRRKEEDEEHEEGLSGRGSTFPPFLSVGISSPGPGEHDAEGSGRRCGGKGISVIQHTSSFDKILNALKDPQLSQQLLPKKHCLSRLVRQPKIQEPEILDREQPDAPSAMSCKDAVEFRWPQRSPMLAQLPAEKLPPKKKRFCLAGEIPPCGEYSLERNTAQPHCSSWDSRASHTSSHPVSFEGKPDAEVLRDSQASCLVSEPSGCQRGHAFWGIQSQAVRSIAPQPPLSQECSSAWKERRSRLLVKQVAVREPNQEKSTGQTAKEVSLIEPTSATPVCELNPSGLAVKESHTTPGHLSCHSVEFGANMHQQQKPVEEEKEKEKPWSHHELATSTTSTGVCSNSGQSSQRGSPELQVNVPQVNVPQVNVPQVNVPQVNVPQGVCICVCSQSRPVCVRGLWDSM